MSKVRFPVRLDTRSQVEKFVSICSVVKGRVVLVSDDYFTLNGKSLFCVMSASRLTKKFNFEHIYCECEFQEDADKLDEFRV